MAGEDFTAQYADRAVYLPSLQKGYASFPFKDTKSVRNGAVPANFTLKDLDFLNPDSKLWHCPYVLYSAGQFNRAQIRTQDMVTERKAGTVVLGDSGGYQIGTGKLKAVSEWTKHAADADLIARRWTTEVTIRDRILRWLDRYSDYAMTLDMPLWVLNDPRAQKSSPFRSLSAQQLIDLSYDNLKYFADNRGKASGSKAKFLNILQDAGGDTGEAWYSRVKDFDFEGWAFGGDTKNGIEPLLKWVRRLLDDGKLNSKTEWLHVLQMSPPVNSVLLTALQSRLRELLSNDIRVSYDSSSAFQTSGISQKIAVMPTFTADLKTWRVKNIPYPQHPTYTNKTDIRYLNEIPSPVTDLFSVNDFHAKSGSMETKFLDTLAQHLLTNHNMYVYHCSGIQACDLVFKYKSHDLIPDKILQNLRKIKQLLT